MDSITQLQGILAASGDPQNPSPEELKEMMDSVQTIAVVGISRNPEKPARRVPSYMAAHGYEVIPVNPFVDRVLGKEAKDSLPEVTQPVDTIRILLDRPPRLS